MDPPAPSTPRRLAGALGPVLVGAAALALYGATLRGGTFSDAVQLARRVENGLTLYYNALYLPLGWALHRTLEPLVGWEPYRALQWLSALAGAGAVAVLAATLRAAGARPGERPAVVALVALAPGVWFFSTSAEVHAVQLLGATVATALAWRARAAAPGRAVGLFLAAAFLALLSHLSTVLVLPGLLVLAWGPVPGRGLGLRRLPWRALALGAAAAALAVLVVARAFEAAGGLKDPFAMLGVFAGFLRAKVVSEGWFSPREVGSFLAREALAPAGMLVLLVPLALVVRGDRLLVASVAVALAPYLLLLPQGGIREGGAYYLTLYPLVALAAVRGLATRFPARSPAGQSDAGGDERGPPGSPSPHARAGPPLVAGVLGLLVLGQLALGWSRAVADGGGEDARDWARRVQEACPPGSVVYTSTLPRWHALSFVGEPYEAVDLWRVFELSPRSAWQGHVDLSVVLARQSLEAGKRVFLDVDLLRAEDRPPALELCAAAFEERFPTRVPLPPEDPLVVELLPD